MLKDNGKVLPEIVKAGRIVGLRWTRPQRYGKGPWLVWSDGDLVFDAESSPGAFANDVRFYHDYGWATWNNITKQYDFISVEEAVQLLGGKK
jgi:hypothetical protein